MKSTVSARAIVRSAERIATICSANLESTVRGLVKAHMMLGVELVPSPMSDDLNFVDQPKSKVRISHRIPLEHPMKP